RLRFASRTQAGEYVIVPRGEVTAAPIFEAAVPTKFAKGVKELTAGELLDSLFLGTEGWTSARDDAVWAALLAWIEETEATAPVIRRVNDLVAVALCLRNGLDITPMNLPNPGTAWSEETEQ